MVFELDGMPKWIPSRSGGHVCIVWKAVVTPYVSYMGRSEGKQCVWNWSVISPQLFSSRAICSLSSTQCNLNVERQPCYKSPTDKHCSLGRHHQSGVNIWKMMISTAENKVQNETIIVLHRCDLTAHFVIDNNLLLLKKVIYRAHVNFLSCLITWYLCNFKCWNFDYMLCSYGVKFCVC